jgi:chemotaxis protein methyltransferase CheR
LRPVTTPAKDARAGLVEGEYPFTISDFRRIASVLRSDVGIMLTEAKAPLVYARLVKRLRALGLESFRAYGNLIASEEGDDERRRMISALTTNITRFFREPHHFQHLKEEVLPPLIARAKKGGRVRIWSAGCSSGEEPYSIALTIASLMPDAHQHDIKILATDIDGDILQKAREGIYSQSNLEPVSAVDRERAFQRVLTAQGRRVWQAGPSVRNLISFKELNLVGDWPMRGPFDAIFCRNTVIYFDEAVQVAIWKKMAPLMPAGATLFIGHSERVTGTRAFEPVGLTTYHRVGDA